MQRLKRILLLLAFVGFLVQVTNVSVQFFAFKTNRVIRYLEEKKQMPLGTTVCMSVYEIMDWHKAGRPKPDKETWLSTSANLTLDQLFRYTPLKEHVIRHIRYRDENGRYRSDSENEWQERVRMEKYHSQGMICYKVSMNFNYNFHPDTVTLANSFVFQLYTVIFSQKVQDVSEVSITLNKADMPYTSRKFSSVFSTHESNAFEAYKTVDIVHLLPAPYDTGCTDNNHTKSFRCKQRCMIDGMAGTGFLPSSELLDEPLSLRVMPIFPDEALVNSSRSTENKCRKQCVSTACIRFHSVTIARSTKRSNESLTVTVRTQKHPSKVTTTVPAMSFIDFFSFICSCFGTWFGISFLSVNLVCQRALEKYRLRQNHVLPFAEGNATPGNENNMGNRWESGAPAPEPGF